MCRLARQQAELQTTLREMDDALLQEQREKNTRYLEILVPGGVTGGQYLEVDTPAGTVEVQVPANARPACCLA